MGEVLAFGMWCYEKDGGRMFWLPGRYLLDRSKANGMYPFTAKLSRPSKKT